MPLSGQLGIRLMLWMGATVPRPAPAEALQALESVEVTSDQDRGDGVQLVFRLVKDRTLDYGLLRNPIFTPGNRVIVGVVMGIMPEILLDGLITHQEVSTGSGGQLAVMAKDISAAMDLKEKNGQFENQYDSDMVHAVLNRYPSFELVREVTETAVVWSESERTPRQYETDLDFLKRIAGRNGFVFYTEAVSFEVNRAYWGPENRLGVPQPALTYDMGAMSNVKSLTFSFDALQPVAPEGFFLDPIFKLSIPIPPLPSLKLPPLAGSPAPALRTVIARDTANRDAADAATALIATTTNAPNAVKGNGELDTTVYGHVLRPRRLVGVRGVGLSLDGLYMVDSVTHTLARGEYSQRFQVSREGLGTITTVVRV